MKYLSIIKYVLIVVSALSVLLYFFGAIDVDFMLRWAYVLLGIAIVAAILFPIFNIVQNPQGTVRSLIGLAIVAVVLGICYALSSDTPITTVVNTFDNPTTLKLSDMGLYAAYAALTGAILSIVVGEISNFFK